MGWPVVGARSGVGREEWGGRVGGWGSALEAGGRSMEHPACAGPGFQGEGCLLES